MPITLTISAVHSAPLPELLLVVPAAGALLCRVAPGPRAAAWVNRIASAGALVVALALAAQVAAPGAAPWRGAAGWLYVDALSGYMAAVVTVVAAIAAWYSPGYLRRELDHREIRAGDERRYYFWFHLFVATMCAVCTVDNMGLMWAAIEATTFASALLVGFYRKEAALEAAWKYLILCSAGITLALGGVILLYYAGVQAFGPDQGSLDWSVLAGTAGRLNPRLMSLAFVLLLVGYGTKAGLAPMHTWLPDAHSQAPSPVSAVLSGVLLNCALYGILRMHALVGAAAAAGAGLVSGAPGSGVARSYDLLIAVGLFSVAVAVPFVLVQHDLKRLLAYSSVEHTGLVALAIGIGTPLALYGGVLHVLTHAVTKTLLFCSAGTLIQDYGTKRLSRLRGAAQVAPLTGILFLLGALAIGGSPPFGPFVSEFAILAGAFAAHAYVTAGVLLLCLAGIFAGIIYHAMRTVLGAAPKRLRERDAAHASSSHGSAQWPLLVALALIVWLGVWIPSPLRDAVSAAAGVLPVRPSAATSLAGTAWGARP